MKKLFVLLVIPFFPALALAAETVAANPVGDAVASLFSGVVVPVLASLLLGLIGVVLNKIRVKTGLQISDTMQQQLERAALAGVAFAEEKAAAAIKSKIQGLTGREKLDLAISHVLASVPKVSREQADIFVHAALGKVSGPGASERLAVK